MVGYWENDPMTTNQKLIAGVFSGVMTRFVTHPMDVIKTRVQLVKKAKKGAVVTKMFKRIYSEEGVKAFWQGHSMGQVHSILSVSSQFYVYELATRYAAKFGVANKHPSVTNFICGVMSGVVSTTLVIPLEVLRVRQMIVHDQYGGFLNGVKNIYLTGGIKAFYEGLGASLCQMGPSVGISFSVFTLVQRYILHVLSPSQNLTKNGGKVDIPNPEYVMVASSIAGSLAGFLSKTLTYPFDLVKRRLQIKSHVADEKFKVPTQVQNLVNCYDMKSCFINSYKKEGVKGLFRGWKVTIYKSQITSIVAFTTYEMACNFIRTVISKRNQ